MVRFQCFACSFCISVTRENVCYFKHKITQLFEYPWRDIEAIFTCLTERHMLAVRSSVHQLKRQNDRCFVEKQSQPNYKFG